MEVSSIYGFWRRRISRLVQIELIVELLVLDLLN